VTTAEAPPETTPIEITEPGVYDIDAETYHADPVPGGSLSSSGARKLLPPSCPALFRYEQEHPTPSTKPMELGTAAHKLVLGVGPELVRIDADEWRTKKVKDEVATVRAEGGIPLKPAEYEQVQAMAAALRAHPLARRLLARGYGQPERAVFWRDEATGVMRRALLDWLPVDGRGRPVIADYKTTVSANPKAIAKTVEKYGYHCQAPWYLDALHAVSYPRETAFVFIFQEKTPPYLVTVAELDADALRTGRSLNRRAINLYARCKAADRWPGYCDDIAEISLPPWVVEAADIEEIA
jgi:hypothetical protein